MFEIDLKRFVLQLLPTFYRQPLIFGLLSRVAKDSLPNCRVIYNDFDHYDERLANVGNTNALLRSIAPLLADVPDNKKNPHRDERNDT